MKIIRLLNSAIAAIEQWLIILSLVLMIACSFITVILRALYSHSHFYWANNILSSIDWSEPFVRLLVLWIAFLGASLLTRDNRHINIDILSSLLPFVYRRYRDITLSIISALVCLILMWASIEYIKIEFHFKGSLFPGMPAWIGHMIIPLGFMTISGRFIINTFEQFLILLKRCPNW